MTAVLRGESSIIFRDASHLMSNSFMNVETDSVPLVNYVTGQKGYPVLRSSPSGYLLEFE